MRRLPRLTKKERKEANAVLQFEYMLREQARAERERVRRRAALAKQLEANRRWRTQVMGWGTPQAMPRLPAPQYLPPRTDTGRAFRALMEKHTAPVLIDMDFSNLEARTLTYAKTDVEATQQLWEKLKRR